MIIDFHTHIFPDSIANYAMERLENRIKYHPSYDGKIDSLLSNMQKNGIDYSVVLPIATKPSQVEIINDESIKINKTYKSIIPFGTMHPDYQNYKEELRRLKENGIKGVKLHPIYQKCDIDSPKYIDITKEAFKLNLMVIFHAGLDPGFIGALYSSCTKIRSFLNKINLDDGILILAHMGSLLEPNDSYEYILSKNLYIDTAMSLGTINTYDGIKDITDIDMFLKMIKKHGSDKILFGSDNPWIDSKSMVDIINDLSIDRCDIDNILYKNAYRLLKIGGKEDELQ
ncbi:amidohydrolase family protein [bacterium]|nr:amidohydrolase family protein [bacterium]